MSGPEAAVLAIDGGNSKTDLALVAADGSLLALVRGPGVPLRLGEETLRVLSDLLVPALARAGLPVSAGAAGPPAAAQLVACVANADLPAEERELQRLLAGQGWARSVFVANDTFAVLRAGLGDVPAAGAPRHWGIGVTCGTGINCAGVAPDGRTARFLALGRITGDWGGGLALGESAQWHAARAADGRGPQTTLRHAVPAHFGLAEPEEVAIAIHEGRIFLGELADLAPVVFRESDAGDKIARGLVLRLAREIALLVRSAARRLGLTGEPVPVVLGGGVVAAGNDLLVHRASELIAAELPAARVAVVTQPPVTGAALIGLDLTGAAVPAKTALRADMARRAG